MDQKTPPLVVIIGETASGKSELALALAECFGGEIICADSWTVRRGVDIGTAKPDSEDRARVPHHLLDVVEPCGDFTAAVFKDLANDAIRDIASRGKLPVMAGGTGLYIDSVLYDYGFLPAGDRAARERFNSMTVTGLLARIKEQGIELGDVDIRNKRRLIRLIETNGELPQKKQLRSNTRIIGLKTERERLKDRIERRTDAMIAAGLEDEVRGLAEQYGWGCEALKGVGYAEWHDYFDGSQTLYETRQKIIKATLDLAKRQRTWFKRNKSIHWVDTPVNEQDIIDEITTFLNT
ncbi:MAG TPA: tRNA (adenosine(37)-N6)-dimethylallyltransferase MiaA [Candidatus Saccharimonadales bacterium]|nr:tRNA (adenosine(37)-N6)-dimethylallyltransferase MiaA [Candidatus Saccharimonadales bacterium]